MNNIFFWRDWRNPYRLFYWIIFSLFMTGIIGYVILYYIGNSFVYQWDIVNNIEAIKIPVLEFWEGIFKFNIIGNNFINIQEFTASNLQVNVLPAIIFIGFFFFGLSVILGVITTLSRFWFLISISAFILLLTFFNLESLELFGTTNKTALVITISLYAIPAYILHAIYTKLSVISRIIIFILISLAFAFIVWLCSGVSYPFLYLANYGIIIPVLISLLFIFIIAHDIVSFFVRIITSSNNEYSKNSNIHFALISIVYLMTLLLLFLYNIKVLDWDLIFINPFLIFIFSAIYGIWEYQKRSSLFQNSLPFTPYGAYLYLGLGIIAVSTISYFFITANDPLIETFEDAIIISHLGFGLMFFIYVMVNFYTLLHNNYPVYKVLYDPKRMPYFTARLAGFIAVLAFFFQSGKISLYQAQAGYFNGIGDIYKLENNLNLAKEYYNEGRIYGFKNHHSNYGLASIASERNNPNDALYFFNEATQKKPTPHSYINMSNIYKNNDRFFEALFTLRDGLNKFPGHGAILNNLALLYNKTNIFDSTLYYMDAASETGLAKEESYSNRLAMLAFHKLTFEKDSLIEMYHNSEDIVTKTNLLPLINLAENPINRFQFPFYNDSLLTFNQLGFLNNYLAYQLYHIDTAHYDYYRQAIRNSGSFLNNDLNLSLDFVLYANKDIYDAFQDLNQLAFNSTTNSSYYYNILGMMALNENAPLKAIDLFKEAEEEGDTTYLSQKIVAHLNAGNFDRLQQLAILNPQGQINQFPLIVNLIDWIYDESKIHNPSDSLKYLWIKHYDPEDKEVLNSIKDPELRAFALLTVVNNKLDHNQFQEAEDYLEQLNALPVINSHIEDRILLAEMKYYYKIKNNELLADQLNQLTVPKKPDFIMPSLLYKAYLAESAGNPDSAEIYYDALARKNPFFEEGIIAAAQFFNNVKKNDLKAYSLLLNALNINEYSFEIIQAFIKQAIVMGLDDFAQDALEEYKMKSNNLGQVEKLQELYDSLITDKEKGESKW